MEENQFFGRHHYTLKPRFLEPIFSSNLHEKLKNRCQNRIL